VIYGDVAVCLSVCLSVCCSLIVDVSVIQKLKSDVAKDISLAEAGKYGSLTDFAFFDKVGRSTQHSVRYQSLHDESDFHVLDLFSKL